MRVLFRVGLVGQALDGSYYHGVSEMRERIVLIIHEQCATHWARFLGYVILGSRYHNSEI